MKLVLNTLIVLAVSFLSQQAAAITAADAKKISVTIALSVQKKINVAPPEMRKKLEAAIKVGNQFIPLHFSGQAYDSDPNNEAWTRNTEPLIALDRDTWTEQWESSVHRERVKFQEKDAYVTRLVCPQIKLIGLEQDDEGISLLYRTVSIGKEINYQGNLYDFSAVEAGLNYDLRIELNRNMRVEKVIYPDGLDAQGYNGDVDFFRSFDPAHHGYETRDHLNDMIRTYPVVARKIEEQAALICR